MAAHTPLLTLTLTFPEMALHILSHRGVPVGLRVTPFADCWDHKARSWPDKAQFEQDVRLLQPRARLIDPQYPLQYGIDLPTMPDLHSRQCSVPDRTMCWGSTSGALPPMANGVPGQTSPRKLGILYMQEYWKC